MTDVKPILVSVPEAMRMLGIGRTKFYQLVGAGDVQLVKIGAKSLVTVGSLERFTASLLEAA